MSLWSLIWSSWNQSFSYSITTANLIIILLLLSSEFLMYWICWSYQDCFLCLSDIYLTIFIWLLHLICLMYLMMILSDNVISCFTHFIHHWHYSASCSYLFHFSLHCIYTAFLQFHLWVINLIKSSTNSSINSNNMIFSQDLLCLSDHCVLIVYQLKQFELMNYVYASLISNNIISLVHNIITLYFASMKY